MFYIKYKIFKKIKERGALPAHSAIPNISPPPSYLTFNALM